MHAQSLPLNFLITSDGTNYVDPANQAYEALADHLSIDLSGASLRSALAHAAEAQTGATVSAHGYNVSDVDFSGGEVTIRNRDTGSVSVVPLATYNAALIEWRRRLAETDAN